MTGSNYRQSIAKFSIQNKKRDPYPKTSDRLTIIKQKLKIMTPSQKFLSKLGLKDPETIG